MEFRRGDMTSLGFPDCHFDAVVCVFGIFFVPDMEAQVAELWRMVRPGGRLAITTWGKRFWSPAYELWLKVVRRRRPDLRIAFNPWDRITTTDAVYRLLQNGEPRMSKSMLRTGTRRCVPRRTSGRSHWAVGRVGRSIRWAPSWLER